MLREYGLRWMANRVLYEGKLKLLRAIPVSEKAFEKRHINIKRLDIFTIDTRAIAAFLKELPDEKQKELLGQADDMAKGQIWGFSSIMLDYGNPINWQLNPLTGKSRDGTAKWFKIPDFDPELGDIKVVWEASRFSHFCTLARAYLLSGNMDYYKTFSRQLSHWLKENPYSYGANFKCGQECAFRLINGLIAYTVFAQEGIATQDDESNIKELIGRCYKKILSNFFYAYRCIKNNHTLSELAGMAIGAWCCADNRKLNNAYRMLDRVICAQFMNDGGYTQYSFNYQRLALQDIECVLNISLKTGRQLCHEAQNRAAQSSLLLYQCQSVQGEVPNYGSNDGALVFPLTSCSCLDFRPTLNCVYGMITGARLYDFGLYDEELVWFGAGADALPKAHIPRTSSFFPEAGLYVLRRHLSFAMIVLNEFKTRPGHMDQLHLDLWVRGVNVLCDLGTYSYASKGAAQLWVTSGHNTVKVSGLEQMNKVGTFMLKNWTARKNVQWHEKMIAGTMVSKNGYTHRRTVVITEKGYRVTDEVESGHNAPFGTFFHTPCTVEPVKGGLALSHEGRQLCQITAESGVIRQAKAERSRYYLCAESINRLYIQGTDNTKNRTITVDINILQEE